jgi:hypothetical protein
MYNPKSGWRSFKTDTYNPQHLNETQSKWSTFDKEFYAIVHAILTFQIYVHGTTI